MPHSYFHFFYFSWSTFWPCGCVEGGRCY